MYGEPFLRSALGFAPVNEMGVVFLFGAMAEKLGFIVTWIGTQYPDVEAFREVAPGRWQRVRIEVEFMSRNFLQHFHDPKECDLIVCWENNWAECPVEVICAEGVIANLFAADFRRWTLIKGKTKAQPQRTRRNTKEIRRELPNIAVIAKLKKRSRAECVGRTP